MVNSLSNSANVTINIEGMNSNPSVTVTTLSATVLTAANPAGQPTLVSPTTKQVTLQRTDVLIVPGYPSPSHCSTRRAVSSLSELIGVVVHRLSLPMQILTTRQVSVE